MHTQSKLQAHKEKHIFHAKSDANDVIFEPKLVQFRRC